MVATRGYVDLQLAALNAVLAERDRAVQERHTANRVAVDKAEAAVNERLEGMNRFRQQLVEERQTYLTRVEYDVHHDELARRVAKIENDASNQQGRFAAATIAMGVLFFIISLTVGIALKLA